MYSCTLFVCTLSSSYEKIDGTQIIGTLMLARPVKKSLSYSENVQRLPKKEHENILCVGAHCVSLSRDVLSLM